MNEEILDRLLALYKTELAIGPFPAKQVYEVGRGDEYASSMGI